MNNLRWLSILLTAAAIPTLGLAENVAYSGQLNPQTIPPLQAWDTGSLGMDFTVNAPISVDAMGVYNANGTGVLQSVLQVAIYAINPDGSGTLVPGTFALFNPATPNYSQDLANDGLYDVYQSISSVVLNPGNYSVVAYGFDQTDPNGNSGFPGGVGAAEDNSGLLTYIGSARYDSNGQLDFPTTLDTGPANRYDAGTFEFSAATPEPGTIALLGAGLILLGAARKRPFRG